MTTVKALMQSARYCKFYLKAAPGPGMAVQIDGEIVGVVRHRTEKQEPQDSAFGNYRGESYATQYYITGEDARPYRSGHSAASVLVARHLREIGELGGCR